MAIYRENTYSVNDESNWKVTHCPKGYSFMVKRDDNSVICGLHNGLTPMDKSLASLLSAAPDLLVALEKMIYWHGERNPDDDSLLPMQEQSPEIQTAIAAIQKARGRS